MRYTDAQINKRYNEFIRINGTPEQFEKRMQEKERKEAEMEELQDAIDLLMTRIKYKDYDPTEKKTHGWKTSAEKRGN